MRRLEDYRRNAEACRDLARKMPPAHREHLLEMARAWDEIAAERERFIASNELPPVERD